MRELYINGSVATVDSKMSYVEAFAVEDGKFIKTGTNEEILALKTADSAVVDLGGKTVMPGFNDAHLHILNWASYHGEDRAKIDLEGVTSIEELIEKVREYIQEKNIPEGKWVVGRGWNENNYAEKRCINYADLDRISTVHPIVLTRIDEHVVAVNSLGLERIGITDKTPNPAGGHIQRDENGKATGLLQENARYMAYALLPDADVKQIKKLLINVMDYISKLGITSVSTDDFETFSSKNWKYILQAYKELEEEGKLKVRITEQCLLITKPQLLEFLDAGYKTGWGSDMFKIGPLKVVSDGTIGSATALLQAPYSDHPETCGMAEFEEEVMDDLIITAHKGGMQILCHAIGDGAAKMCLRAFDQMLEIKPVDDPRCGLVHVQIADQEIFDKMRDNKVMAFITIEDLLGTVEVVIFPRDYEKNQQYLEVDRKVFVRGRVSEEDESNSKLICETIIPFEQTEQQLWIQYPDKGSFLQEEQLLYSMLHMSEGDQKVFIYCQAERAVKQLPAGRNVEISEELLGRLTNYFGKERVKVVEKSKI